uniref:Exportin-2 n=1 Tax=Phallusia mammillata TaxID=59560 RepID=A0A6F9DAN2_9ASCI|nr:exportin-2 [Phallusia mammillata]
MNQQDFQTLASYLEQTLSPDTNIRRQAEKFLEKVEQTQGYALMLLKLVEDGSKQQAVTPVPLASAISFKNFVKRNWHIIEDEPSKINEEDRTSIKANVVNLMLHSPEQYQKQLSEAISIIGREDFPDKWPSLIPEVVSKFADSDFHIINGVLQTAHSLFKRYRHEFRSDKLWQEIKYVLDGFADPLTKLFENTIKLASEHSNDKGVLKILFSSLVLMSKVFYSLNYQDLPEFFEDNMKIWMDQFHMLLTTDNTLLHTQGNEEAGYVELLKSQICDNIALYAQKYDEEFAPYLPQFVRAVWNLLVNTGKEVKYDLLVSNAIGFLRSVCERPQYKSLFEEEGLLVSVCEKVVVPNMEFRPSDEEQFEDNPEEYIRRDLEGSDVDTRRRAACDLVRGLTKQFQAPVTQIFSQYVGIMLQQYSSSPTQHWKSKDAAIYLVTSLAQKGSTAKLGTTQSNELVNLQDFFSSHILPELNQAKINEHSVLKADSIKYVVTFRTQLERDNLLHAIRPLIELLASSSQVVHTYAAHAIERILMIKSQNNKPLITKEDIQPVLENLLGKIFACLEMPGSEENEYVMKTLMRVLSLGQELLMPYMGVLVNGLTQKLVTVSKNPSKPHFNHYLFEALSLCIRVTCRNEKKAVASFEEALFGIFTNILMQDVTEFIPYVFQVMSLLLEMHDPPAPDTYMTLFPHLLNPALWERPGNVPALVRLVQAFIEKAGDNIAKSGKLNNLLGVFQKLIASKANDHYGFYLLNTMVEYMKPEVLESSMKQIYSLLFQRLMRSKTVKFVRGLLVFFALYITKNSADSFQGLIDSIQDRMFGMVLEKLIISELQKVSGTTERKICSVGFTKLLTSCTALLDENYSHFWPRLLESVIGLFELPEDDTVPDDEHFVEIEDTPGYQTAYSQLAFAGKREHDPVSVENPKAYLAQSLGSLAKHFPGKVPGMVGFIDVKAREFLQGYLNAAQVQLF